GDLPAADPADLELQVGQIGGDADQFGDPLRGEGGDRFALFRVVVGTEDEPAGHVGVHQRTGELRIPQVVEVGHVRVEAVAEVGVEHDTDAVPQCAQPLGRNAQCFTDPAAATVGGDQVSRSYGSGVQLRGDAIHDRGHREQFR